LAGSSAPHCSISLPQTDRPLAPFDDQGYSFSPIVVSAKRVNGKKQAAQLSLVIKWRTAAKRASA
jgi:hypothetical protein